MVTLDTVVQFNREYERAQALVDEALARRNAAVLDALRGGATQTQIALRLGVSRGRVSQIAAAAGRHRREATDDAIREAVAS